MKILVNEPKLTKEDVSSVMACVKSGWVSSVGPYLEEFEKAWAQYCNRKHGVAVCNGTAALEVAVAALELSPGDEVILPSFTIISPILAILRAQLKPVLVDCDPLTYGMDPKEVAKKISRKTKLILPIHLYGHPVDMDPILDLASKYGLKIIEDAAEAHGAKYLSGRKSPESQWKKCGSFGDLSSFSFYANKLICTGEGGMVLTDSDDLKDKLCSLRNLANSPEKRFHHRALGYNYRMTNLQAALGLRQIDRIDSIIERKREIASTYQNALCSIEELQIPLEETWAKSVYWMYGLVANDEKLAVELKTHLHQKGIETRDFFFGMHEQPVFKKQGLFVGETYPITEKISRCGFYVPSGLGLKDNQQKQVISVIQKFFGKGIKSSKTKTTVFGQKYAELYDEIYREKNYSEECDVIESLFEKYGSGKIKRVLDLGCGTGNHSIPLAKRGYQVCGTDRSPSMIQRAKEKSLKESRISFREADLRNLQLEEKFDAALMLFAVLGYQISDTDVRRALKVARKHLDPGGLLICDVWYGPAVLHQGPTTRKREIALEAGNLVRLAKGNLIKEKNLVNVEITTQIQKDGQVAEETYETHSMRYFFEEELQRFLKESDFESVQILPFLSAASVPSEQTWNIIVVAQATGLNLDNGLQKPIEKSRS